MSKQRRFNNEDEEAVLSAKLFSSYKGSPVIKIAGLGGRSFSFGAMFISPKETAEKGGADTVRHEYGHIVQLKALGLLAYIKYIAKPSVKSKVSGPEYFDQPWEVTADVLGGASRYHDEAAREAGEAYLSAAKKV
jgi:hypothetical protein